MKNKAITCILGLALLLSVVTTGDVNVYASQTTANEITATRASDIIETKYRIYKGKLQYRRWNATLGCWYDPDWIDY